MPGPAVAAILPVFFLIFLGGVFRRTGFPGTGFWEPVERLTYYLLFPVLIVGTLARADLAGLAVAPMVVAVLAAQLALALGLLAARPLLRLAGPAFSSLFQGSIRFNTYIGLAVAFGAWGEPGVAAAAVALAALLLLGNLLSVAIVSRFGAAAPPAWPALAGQMARNPLIIACLAGLALNLSGLGVPAPLAPLLSILGPAALPLGLLAVGAGLDFTAAAADGRTIALATVLKLAVLPALTAAACWALGIAGTAAFVAILFNGLPPSPGSYILARQLGGDARLMAGLITVETALALVSLPLVLALLS